MGGYFKDDKGNKSAMRLMSGVALIAAVIFAWLVITGDPDPESTKIVFGFLIAAFAPKAVQKFAEREAG